MGAHRRIRLEPPRAASGSLQLELARQLDFYVRAGWAESCAWPPHSPPDGYWTRCLTCEHLTAWGDHANLGRVGTIVSATPATASTAPGSSQNWPCVTSQTDSEYGCHDTTISYSQAARQAFQIWLRGRYSGPENDGDITALNNAWGNIFWSMEYYSFDKINLPNLTVTEANPSHHLDFRLFTSNQVVSINKLQTDIIRQHSDAPIAHNYMGRMTNFDNFKVGADLDIAS